jgi:predicted RNA-binding Zn ribbon-like protein
MSSTKQPTESSLLFLAGHPALDFLNTRMRVNGELVDFFQCNDDVLRWLEQAGFPVISAGPNTASMRLLNPARKLRENIRMLVEKRKAGQRGDPSLLNEFLTEARSHPQLVWKKPGSLKIARVRKQNTPKAILAPIAEAAAELLTTADLSLVKRCEDEACVLWFSDQTKSHHRRWCSMELCGNRHKVAAYRKRRRDEGA